MAYAWGHGRAGIMAWPMHGATVGLAWHGVPMRERKKQTLLLPYVHKSVPKFRFLFVLSLLFAS
jgi:hypothetical protein